MQKSIIDYSTIELTPAKELLALSIAELDKFIIEAREQRERAARIIQWLTAIKLEKSARDSLEEDEQGGVE